MFRRVYHSRVLCLQNIVKSNRLWFLKICNLIWSLFLFKIIYKLVHMKIDIEKQMPKINLFSILTYNLILFTNLSSYQKDWRDFCQDWREIPTVQQKVYFSGVDTEGYIWFHNFWKLHYNAHIYQNISK